jgi:hypothetical protein
LQAAVYAALTADAQLDALIDGRVYDFVPNETAFPFVSFGPVNAGDWSTLTTAGAETFFVLDFWSRKPGRVQAQAMMARAYSALHAQTLILSGHAVAVLRIADSRVIRDPDGVTTHGVMRFRALTQATGEAAWLVAAGAWDDGGIWDDDAAWIDAA